MSKVRRFSVIYFLILGLTAGCAAKPATTPVQSEIPADGLLIDKVWSGSPVSFDVLTQNGHQFIAYYDADRRITLAAREIGQTSWTIIHPEGVYLKNRKRTSNITDWDSHNYLRMALDKEGCLHLSGNMHNDPLIYYRTRRPYDITTIERIDRMTGDRENQATYPVFFKNSAGELLFRYRDGGSGNGSDIYNIYDTQSRTWRHLLSTSLLDGQGQRNAYALDPILGPDKRFHLVWMWRDTPDCSTNNNLSYARSADFIHWEKTDGTPIELPITRETGQIIDPAKNGEGLINMTFNLGFDARNRPVVTYHRYDAGGKSQVYAARPTLDGKRWEISQLSNWDFRWRFGGMGSITAEVTLGPAVLQSDKNLLVDYTTTHDAGSGRWLLDTDTLRPIRQLPAPEAVLPANLMSPLSGIPDMKVQTAVSRDAGRRWVVRWETLPRNRDQARDHIPPPTEMRIFEEPDSDTGAAHRVGS